MNALLRHPNVLHQLQQCCALCGQRVASSSNMKNHYDHSHTDFMHKHATQISNVVTRKATACFTCHFCGGKFKAWRLHLKACTVAWQCAVISIHQDNGHGQRAVEVFRASQSPVAADPNPAKRARQEESKGSGKGRKPERGRDKMEILVKSLAQLAVGVGSLETGLLVGDVGEARREHGVAGALPNSTHMEISQIQETWREHQQKLKGFCLGTSPPHPGIRGRKAGNKPSDL